MTLLHRGSVQAAVWMTFLFLLLPPARSQDVQVQASVSADTVGVDDEFELTITITGADSGDATAPSLRPLKNFQVLQGPNSSTQFQWINGRSSSSKSFTYTLMPRQEGEFTIEPVEVHIGQKVQKTQPITIRVLAGSVPGRTPPTQRRIDPFWGNEDLDDGTETRIGERDVFITAELDRPSAFVGEQVTLTYRLYTKVAITGLQLQDNPPLTGFWVEAIEVPSNPSATSKIINGEEYSEYVVKKQALFPTKEGVLKIPPSTFAVSARKQGDFFSFFAQTQTLYRRTHETELRVRPLPERDRPAEYGNAVGRFHLTASLDKDHAATGEAVSLIVRLEGRGNLKMIPDIQLPPLPDFSIYSSKSSDNVRPFEGDLIGGDKTWEYVIVPKAPGMQTIPAITFDYFDPQREKYEVVTTQPLSLKVDRGTDTVSSLAGLSGISRQNLTRQGTDINFIKLDAGDLSPKRKPIYVAFWFYALASIPLAANAGIFLYQKRRSSSVINITLVRSRKARRTALRRLARAQKAGGMEPRRFYDEASSALSCYLADKFTLPMIAVTADTLERTLTERSVPPEAVKAAVHCLQECDFGRFVTASPSHEKMKDIADRIRGVIDDLEQT